MSNDFNHSWARVEPDMVRRIALLLVMLVPAMPVQVSDAQEKTGTIIFRSYGCPWGYDVQFLPDVCGLSGAGAVLERDGKPVETRPFGGSGEEVFVVTPGSYQVMSQIPGDFAVKWGVDCNTIDGPNEDFLLLEAGETWLCEERVFPDSNRASNPADELDLSLTIRVRICDEAIDRTSFYDACFGRAAAGRSVWISSSEFESEVVTDSNGNVTLDIPDYTFTFAPQGVASDHRLWRYCTSAAYPGIPMRYPLDVRFHKAAVTCDVYLIPKTYDLAPGLDRDKTGVVGVHYRRCPAGYDREAYYRDCHDVAIADATVDLGQDNIAIGRGYTDDRGNVSFRVAPGTYDLPPGVLGDPVDHIAVFCSSEDAAATVLEYPVVVEAGDHITCDLYLLPGRFMVG